MNIALTILAVAWLAFPLTPCFADSHTLAEAVNFWSKAAEQGDAVAQFNFGVMYQTGIGVPQDNAEAVKWFRKAAEQGDAKAQFALGMMCDQGKGVQRDSVQAYMWLSLAAAKDGNTRSLLDSIARGMTPNQIADAKKLAAAWKPTAN
jgi:TPR repeat protein